jgi:ribosomal protein S18 acetylase RimI-like enzyme
MNIQNSTLKDLEEIFRLYQLATDFQKSKNRVNWPEFSKVMVTKEIEEKKQYKVLIDTKIACVWAIAISDPLIWQEKNKDKAIYIHRIATNPEFKGNNLVSQIVNWAKIYAEKHQIEYIRMDTVGENLGLINYYKKCGFNFLGLSKLKKTTGLPAHYKNAIVSLFEIEVK